MVDYSDPLLHRWSHFAEQRKRLIFPRNFERALACIVRHRVPIPGRRGLVPIPSTRRSLDRMSDDDQLKRFVLERASLGQAIAVSGAFDVLHNFFFEHPMSSRRVRHVIRQLEADHSALNAARIGLVLWQERAS